MTAIVVELYSFLSWATIATLLIILTSLPSKIIEHILFTDVFAHLNLHDLIHPSQHGFGKSFLCKIQLVFQCVHDIHYNIGTEHQTDSIFLDFLKAFLED